MADIEKSLSALTKFLESEEGKESMKKYWEEIEQKEKIYASQVERFYLKWKYHMPFIIDLIMNKYESSEYVNREYKLGYEPRQDLYWVLNSIAEKHGVKIILNKKNAKKYPTLNMFTGSAYTFEGYLFQVMHGQGSVVRIDKLS
jgi:hypothetical protein